MWNIKVSVLEKILNLALHGAPKTTILEHLLNVYRQTLCLHSENTLECPRCYMFLLISTGTFLSTSI